MAAEAARLQPPPLRNVFQSPGAPGIDRDWINWLLGTFNAINGIGFFLEDTHANRLANSSPANFPSGSVFYETDRKVTYIIVGGVWVYLTGKMATSQSGLPTDLGANDTGFLAGVSDYHQCSSRL